MKAEQYWPDAIICPEHGQVFFDEDEETPFDYEWFCPRCGLTAEYDWDNYDAYEAYLDSVLPGGLQGACR